MIKPLVIFRISLFFLILWPTYIALKIGGVPALSIDRLMQGILIVIFILYFVYKKKERRLKFNKSIVIVLLTYFIWNLFSSIFGSENIGGSISSLINWFILGPFLLLFCFTFITKEIEIYRLINTVILTMFIVNLIGLIEVFKGGSLFKNFLISENDFTLKAASEAARGGVYRVQSVFSNPLVYAQFLLTTIPLQVYNYKQQSTFVIKFLLLLNIIFSVFFIYKTGSRAGLGLVAVMPILILYVSMYKKMKFKVLSNIIIIFIVTITFLGINGFIQENRGNVNNLHQMNVSGQIDQETLSTLARVLQFQLGLKSILANPVFGIGFGESVKAVAPLKSIDNYYLTLVLSTGVVGLLFFIFIIFLVVNRGVKNIRLYHDELTVYLLVSFLLTLMYYFILSIPKANSLMFIISGLIYIKSELLRKKYYD